MKERQDQGKTRSKPTALRSTGTAEKWWLCWDSDIRGVFVDGGQTFTQNSPQMLWQGIHD